jgi:NTE family protein
MLHPARLLSVAVTSSSAIPGVWPPITIKGERWIDGGVRSMLNADLATGCDVVIVVSCFALEVWVGSRIQTWRPQTRR